MNDHAGILLRVRMAADKRVLFLPHALRQMMRVDRMISAAEVRAVVESGEVIENYPEDPRGHSCLLLGFGQSGRPIHVVCAPKSDYLAVITAYPPDESGWSNDFRTRVRR
jgi:hypothetical protein